MTRSRPSGSHDGASAIDSGRAELAESVRRLVAAVTTGTTAARDLAAAKDLVDAALAALGPLPDLAAHRAETEAGRRPTRDPFASPENPLAPPLRELPSEAGAYIARFTLSPAYEGPPGRVHGGVITGILDHASGFALHSLGTVAVSVSLSIDLHHPTPYGEPLTVAARVDERNGRKIWVDAEISTADGQVTASCRTLMLQLREVPVWAQRGAED